MYISHRMEEVYELASRAVVLRDGRFVDDVALAETPEPALIAMMVGRTIEQLFPHVDTTAGDLALRIRGLADGRLLHEADLDVRAGEVMVLVGLNGSGRSEVLRCVAGMTRPTSGAIEVHGNAVTDLTPRQASELGIAWVPEDRHAAGLVAPMTVSANLSLVVAARLRPLRARAARGRAGSGRAADRPPPGPAARTRAGAPRCCPAATSRRS